MGLVVFSYLSQKVRTYCFNPCYSGNGFGSKMLIHGRLKAVFSFNPCYSGNGFGRILHFSMNT